MVLLVLLMRMVISKDKNQPKSMLDTGYLWYDQGSVTANKEFGGYSIFDNGTTWFDYCFDRKDTPDRTIIALAPASNTIMQNIKTRLEADLLPTYNFTVNLYNSREEIMNIITASDYEQDGNPGICFGSAFTEASTDKITVNMIFDDILPERNSNANMPNQGLPATDDFERGPNEDAFDRYKIGGYTYMQNIIANEILINTRGTGAYISMLLTGMKTNEYVKDDFAEQIINMWGALVIFVILAPMYRFLYNCTEEKGSKIREAMKIMGLTDLPYWLSWFTYYIILNTLQCLIMTLLLIPVFEYTDKFILFLHLWIYGMSVFGYCIFISAFFSSPKAAGMAGIMLFFSLSFCITLVGDRSVSETSKNLASLFPSLAAQLGGINLLKYEEVGLGVTFSNANDVYENYRFGTCLWMNLISFFIFSVLGIYLENVLPSAVGVRKPLWFPFTKSFWFDTKKNSAENTDNESELSRRNSNKIGNSSNIEENSEEHVDIDLTNFEEVPEYLKNKEADQEFVKISNLKKKFDKFWAVDGLNSEMYEDQIFALLGHNGAGKTTAINMLCGMMAPTSGQASIYGYDINEDMKSLRKIMGYCPQHNILFPKLTVGEHLKIFADFKGKNSDEIQEEINEILSDLNMTDKKNVLSKNLSGGYKRKLSLGIALIGGSKIVFLDEPSSGMDVTARREMWDMLKKYKNNRIIILTTHYMEEADNLGDRIGIMSQGRMLCCGRPEFLKNKFGEGFNLVLVKEQREDNIELENFVMRSIDGVRKVSEVSSEATYLLPKDSKDKFPEFFKELDKRLEELRISSYGVSMTTLEEVFLKVENSGKEEDEKALERIKKRMTSEYNPDEEYTIAKEQVEGSFNIFFLHTWALLVKRYILTKRNIKGLIMDILVPLVLLLSGSWFVTVDHYKDSAQRVLEPDLFPLDQRVIYNTYNVGGRNSADLMSLLDPSSNFTISSVTTSGSTEKENLINFDDQLFNASLVDPLSPSRYGHYYFNFLDYTNYQYEVATFFNSTSQDAHVAFPHFIYEAILKKSISTSFNYTMINDPMPIVDVYEDQIRGLDSLFLLLLYAVALALIPASIIGFLLNERSTNLTHQQTISGMNKAAYWVSNYIFDITRVFVPILIAIALLYIFEIAYSYAWLLLLLFPFAIVPYTYVTSFLFNEDAPAQNFTILHHMIIAGILPIILFILRLNESTQDFGDHVRWIFRLIPSYNTIGGISSIAIKDYIANNRQESPPSPLDFEVAGGDLVFLFIHMILWPCLLILIELGVFDFLRKKGKNVQDKEVQLDDDVEAERLRIEQTSESELAVKANHIRKIFGDKVAVKDISFGLEFGD